MHISLVMTVVGRDRPGLVELVSRLIAGHGGNWLESRMCRLGGEFAGILRVELEEARAGALTQELHALEAQGLKVVLQTDEPPVKSAGTRPGTFPSASRSSGTPGLSTGARSRSPASSRSR